MKPFFNVELYAHLVAKGTDPAVARSLAEQCDPDDEVEVGETEVTSTSPRFTTKLPLTCLLGGTFAVVWSLIMERPAGW